MTNLFMLPILLSLTLVLSFPVSGFAKKHSFVNRPGYSFLPSHVPRGGVLPADDNSGSPWNKTVEVTAGTTGKSMGEEQGNGLVGGPIDTSGEGLPIFSGEPPIDLGGATLREMIQLTLGPEERKKYNDSSFLIFFRINKDPQWYTLALGTNPLSVLWGTCDDEDLILNITATASVDHMGGMPRSFDLGEHFKLCGNKIECCKTEGLLQYEGFRLTFMLNHGDATHSEFGFVQRRFYAIDFTGKPCIPVIAYHHQKNTMKTRYEDASLLKMDSEKK